MADGIGILARLFLGFPPPSCEDAADTDDNGTIELTDAVALFAFLFLGQSAPPEPYPACGVDPTPDALTCEASRCSAPELPLLELTSLCSNDPTTELRFRVRNLEMEPLTLEWQLASQVGAVVLPSLSTAEISTTTVPDDPNLLKLYWQGFEVATEPANFLECVTVVASLAISPQAGGARYSGNRRRRSRRGFDRYPSASDLH